MKFLFLLFLVVPSAYAVDSKECSKLLNDGLYKKYRYMGVGESNAQAMTNGTKRQGSSTASSDVSSEISSAILDPKYTSNYSTSQTQSLSSWGECSLFADVGALKEDRTKYIAQNETEVLIDIARGDGEHLKVLTFYSACSEKSYPVLSKKLQHSFSNKTTLPKASDIGSDIDEIIQNDAFLKNSCIAAL